MKNETNKKTVSAETSADNTARKVRRQGSKRGMYMAATSAIVLAIVIVVNMILGSLPSGTLEFDLSGKSLYEPTQQSSDYLKTLDKDVKIVVLSQKEAIDETVLKFINNYAKLSSHIKLEIIDPTVNPSALKTYNAIENNVVVTCEATNKTRLLQLGGISGSGEGLIQYDANTYYSSGQLNPVALDAEGQLTSAVSYVTSNKTHKLYLMSGHGEASLGNFAGAAISKGNIETASLNLMKDGQIPEGSELILCFNPTNDLTAEELTMLENYLRTGGNVMLFLNSPGLTNFNALLKTYGLQLQDGFVGDHDSYAKSQGYFWIYPSISKSSDITSSINLDAVVNNAFGMTSVTPGREKAVMTPILTTSSNSYLDNGKDAAPASYILGATSVEKLENADNKESRLTVFSAASLISDDLSQYTNLSNLKIFMNAINQNFGETQNISVPQKSLSTEPNTITNPLPWVVVFMVIIPVTIIVVGLAYWSKRRRR